ncbi:MAG TPA: PEGA domain-containing protein [Kofleriaceae bacterium]|nr:PEGA domain-containing protein [Kofleriaceae bacterium]
MRAGAIAGVAVLAALATPGASAQPAAGAPAASAIGRSIAVLGFDALGMEADKVARLETLFRMELERLAGAPTPSPREITRSLRGTPLARCGGENTCLAAIGKKLAVEVVVTGNVAQLGDSHVINIKAIDAVTGKELRRIRSDPLRGTPDELIDAVRVAAYRLLAPERLLGSVTVLADIAGAEVRLDGRPVGKTPLPRALERIPLGTHRLEVVADGYSPFADDVEVRFQKTTRVLVTLAAEAIRPRLDLARRGKPQPAPRRWYDSTWFLVGAGVAAVAVGATIGYALSRQDVVNCASSPESCR